MKSDFNQIGLFTAIAMRSSLGTFWLQGTRCDK